MFLALAALVLIASACGGGEEDAASLPVNDDADTPMIAGACVEDEPDCVDTAVDLEPQDLPSGDATDEPPPTAALAVSAAADATGPVTVTGSLVVVDGEARLCEALAESFPPQCGGASIVVTSFDQVDPDELITEGPVTWADNAVTISGEMVDGGLVATPIE